MLVIISIVALGTATTKAAHHLTNAHKQALKEVKITACARDALGDVIVRGTTHNTSSGRSNYFIDVVVVDPAGTQLDSSNAVASNVDPDQTAKWQAPTTAKFGAGITCKVADVIRTASSIP